MRGRCEMDFNNVHRNGRHNSRSGRNRSRVADVPNTPSRSRRNSRGSNLKLSF